MAQRTVNEIFEKVANAYAEKQIEKNGANLKGVNLLKTAKSQDATKTVAKKPKPKTAESEKNAAQKPKKTKKKVTKMVDKCVQVALITAKKLSKIPKENTQDVGVGKFETPPILSVKEEITAPPQVSNDVTNLIKKKKKKPLKHRKNVANAKISNLTGLLPKKPAA